MRIKKPGTQNIGRYLKVTVHDDRESEYCPVLLEDTFHENQGQTWLTYKEAKKLQLWLNRSIDFLEKAYAQPVKKRKSGH